MKRGVFYILAVLLIMLPGYKAYNQKILYPEKQSPYPWFQRFVVLDGKGGAAVTAVLSDRKGFIWFGIESGLYRFDGLRYYGFPAGRSDSSIFGSSVVSIYEDPEGIIWAGTYSALNRVDTRTGLVRHFFPDTVNLASENNSIIDISEDRNGNLWLQTKKNVFSFNRKNAQFIEYPVNPEAWRIRQDNVHNGTERFCEDSHDRIWIATDNGLYCLEGNNWEKRWPRPDMPENSEVQHIYCVKEDITGNIWFGTQNNGVIRITSSGNAETMEFPFKPDRINEKRVSAIFCDKNGGTWVSCNKVLAQYDLQGELKDSWFLTIPVDTSRNPGAELFINKIFKGSDQSLWMTWISQGILVNFNPATEKFTIAGVPNWIDFDCIPDRNGDMWIGSIYAALYKLNTDSVPFRRYGVKHSSGAQIFERSRLAQDNDGSLWLILRGEGINKIDLPHSNTVSPVKTQPVRLPYSNITPLSVYCSIDGDIWFGCSENSVVRYIPGENKYALYQSPASVYQGIEIITGDMKGNLWFVNPYDAIYVLRAGTNHIEKFLSYEDLPGNMPGTILWDFLAAHNGDLWISTSYGIYRTDSFRSKIDDLTGKDGTGSKYGNWFFRLLEDDNRNIWALNSLKGPHLFNKGTREFESIETTDRNYGVYYCDMNIDGLGRIWSFRNNSIIITDPVSNSSRNLYYEKLAFDLHSVRLRSGEIAVLNGGELIFFPVNPPRNKHIPPVYITSMSVNGIGYNKISEEIDFITDIKNLGLNYRQNTLNLEFASLNYRFPQLNRYRYFMKGMDRDTVETLNANAEYINMPPGKYVFWVTGSNNDGLWNPDGVTLNITIHPPFYKSAMAYIIYILLFASLIVIYVRSRLSRLLKEKIRLEAEVNQRTSELKVKNLQLEEADKIKTRFFTNIAHEIRTPLSLILAPLDKLIGENGDDEKEGSAFELMKRNGQRLMQLVNQLLDISRLDSGKMKIILSETDIIKSIRILVYEFLSIAESKNIRYIVEVPDKELITWADIDKTEKIISNLLSNAFKFTPAGGTVSCSVKLVKGEGSASGNMLEIRTTDSGPGISADHLEKIFDRFYRVETHHGREGTGTGIGLALVQEFVSLLHGNIKVNSIPGKGSEFIVTIPVGKDHLLKDEYVEAGSDEIDRQKPHLLHDIDKAHRSDEARGRETRITLLVIEDNDDLRNFICESMAEDYNVLESEDGKEGASLALTMIPDLIITDLMMPGMDGISLCSLLKNDERTSHIPVIMLTAKATSEERIEGLKSGADDYITKPFNLTELKVRIANLLDQREKLRIRYRNHFAYSLQNNDSASVDDRFMDKIYSIIRENIRDFSFDAGTLHEKAGMSRVHLFRKLKAITGLPPSILIRNIRLETAARCLLSNTGNITEISNSVGISNPSYFTKCFRKHFGVSPKDYSESQKEKA